MVLQTVFPLMKFLTIYDDFTDQKINHSKSVFLVRNKVTTFGRHIIASAIDFNEGKFPIAYFGVPFSYGKIYSSAYDYILLKI